jgi:DNA-directed RNA polymerase III subunit RPC7
MSRGGRSSGKRRGDNALTFSLESMGLSRSETLPPPTLLPPALYPPLDLKPLPLRNNEVDLYLLTLKQEFRLSLTTSKYFINPVKEKPKIERYSDKYENTLNKSVVNGNHFEFGINSINNLLIFLLIFFYS